MLVQKDDMLPYYHIRCLPLGTQQQCSRLVVLEKLYGFPSLLQLLVERLQHANLCLCFGVMITFMFGYIGCKISELSKPTSPHGCISGSRLFTAILLIVVALALLTVRIMPSG